MRALGITVLVLLLAVVGVVLWVGSPQGPSLADVGHLRVPRITTLPAQKVLLVVTKGDPNVVGKRAFGRLMGVYFRLKDAPKGGPGFKPPRARWALDPATPPSEWVGQYAIPVPQSVTSVPESDSRAGLRVEIATWDYGEVAEVLHVGPYAAEQPTIEQLKQFIEQSGYEVAGDHEEEYLKGPGMLLRGNPKDYLTIIRYAVRRKAG